jgi:hypothetical protein
MRCSGVVVLHSDGRASLPIRDGIGFGFGFSPRNLTFVPSLRSLGVPVGKSRLEASYWYSKLRF